MFKIGIAEDDVKIAGLIRSGLEEQGYDVTVSTNGQVALRPFSTMTSSCSSLM